MAVKERKQITGTTAQINAYAGHEGQIVWDKDKKTFVGMSGTAGKNYPLAPKTYVDNEVAKVNTELQETNAEVAMKASSAELTQGLAGKEDKDVCLPKSGGTLLGGWVNLQSADGSGTAQILKHIPGSEYSGVDIISDVSEIENGAVLSLRTNDSSKEASQFLLRTGRNPDVNFLVGTSDGSISWRGQELVRIGGGSPKQDFVIGSNGATYTAPFTGKCCIAGAINGSGGTIELLNVNTDDQSSSSTLPGNGWVRAQVYVRKGDKVAIFYYNWDMNEAYWVGS